MRNVALKHSRGVCPSHRQHSELEHTQRGIKGSHILRVRMQLVIVMTFWYVFGTDLTFSNFLNFIFYSGLITTPHVLYVHMTYVYSFFPYVSLFTRVYGQEKSLSYYDLLQDFGVLFYGRTPTLIFIYFLHHSTTPILPVYIDQRRPHLEKDPAWPRGMIVRQVTTIPRRTLITPD